MDTEKVTSLLEDAKYLYEHGAFGPLVQGEFFKAMTEAIAAEAPPPENPITRTAPPPGPPGPNTDVVKTQGDTK